MQTIVLHGSPSLFPQAFNAWLRRNINNQSSLDLLVFSNFYQISNKEYTRWPLSLTKREYTQGPLSLSFWNTFTEEYTQWLFYLGFSGSFDKEYTQWLLSSSFQDIVDKEYILDGYPAQVVNTYLMMSLLDGHPP